MYSILNSPAQRPMAQCVFSYAAISRIVLFPKSKSLVCDALHLGLTQQKSF